MEENGGSVNQYDSEDVSMSIKAEPEVVFEIDDVNWTSAIKRAISESEKRQNRILRQLTNEISVLRREVADLKSALGVQTPVVHESVDLPQKPFDTVEAFLQFENNLQEDIDLLNQFESRLRSLNIRNSSKFVKTCWRNVISDNVAVHFSWKGTEEKRPIRQFYTTIAIKRHYGNAEENEDSNQDMAKSRRRSRRTRFRNLRYSSPERDGNVAIIPDDDIENDTTKDDDDFLLQEPSSSTQTKRLQPRVMLKRKKNPVIDLLAESLKEIGLYEELYEFMKCRGITADALKYMKLRHIDELFKGTRLSTKIVFEQKLREWQNKKGICEVSTTQSTNSQTAIVKPKIEESVLQMLSSSDANELSNRLMDAIQQAVNTVLTDFKAHSIKKSPETEKLSEFHMECNDEIPFSEEADNAVKPESFAFVNIEETPIPEKIQTLADKKNLNPVGNIKETSTPCRVQKKKREKSPKPSKQTQQNYNNIFLESIRPQERKLKFDVDISVAELLDMIPFGRRFIEEYQSSGLLTPNQRTELVRTVVDFYLRSVDSLTVAKCREIAEQIVEIFPTECLDTYFTQINKSNPPKGKIWDRYRGRKRSLRNVLTMTTTAGSKSESFNNSVGLDETMDKAVWSEMEEMCLQMKNVEDEIELLKQWKKSFTFRRYQLQSESFSNWKLYFDQYPFVKQQNYAQFIDSDLNTLYPNLKFDEYLWEEFLKFSKLFYLNRIKHPKSKQVFEELLTIPDLDSTSDYVAIKVIEILHAIFPPKNLVSIEDAQREFTVEVSDLADLKKVVIERKKNFTENNLASKPYIAVVGHHRTYTHFSVILDSTGFSCDSYKDALILCFNLYLFFDLSFPQETLGVWLFIQKYFFNKPSLVSNPRVETFINDIKAQKKLTADINNGVFG